MSIITSVEKFSEDIGFDIANSNDAVQANLINGLSRGFKNLPSYNFDMQITYISKHLNKDSIKLIEKLYEFTRDTL